MIYVVIPSKGVINYYAKNLNFLTCSMTCPCKVMSRVGVCDLGECISMHLVLVRFKDRPFLVIQESTIRRQNCIGMSLDEQDFCQQLQERLWCHLQRVQLNQMKGFEVDC